MKILYISHDGMSDALGQSQVIPYLVGLSEKGYKITILSLEKKKKLKESWAHLQPLLSESKIDWHFKSYLYWPIFISKWLNLIRLRKTAFALHKKNNYSIVHCRSYFPALVGLKMKTKFGLKFIFDMRGFWADERIDGGIWNKKNPVHRNIFSFFKKKELEFLNNADYIVSLTETAKKEIFEWKGINKNDLKISVIPCCVDLNLFSYENFTIEKIKETKRRLGIGKTDFVLSYIGSIGTWYLVDEMLHFFLRVSKKFSNAKFLFLTNENPEIIFNTAQNAGVQKSSVIVKSARRDEVPLYASLSEVSVFFIKKSFSKKASSPTKMAELLALGIPVITNTGIGDCDNIINATNTGIIIESFSKKNFDDAAQQIEKLLSINKKNIREAAEKYFSLEKGVESYHKIYRDLNSK